MSWTLGGGGALLLVHRFYPQKALGGCKNFFKTWGSQFSGQLFPLSAAKNYPSRRPCKAAAEWQQTCRGNRCHSYLVFWLPVKEVFVSYLIDSSPMSSLIPLLISPSEWCCTVHMMTWPNRTLTTEMSVKGHVKQKATGEEWSEQIQTQLMGAKCNLEKQA